MAAQTWHIVDEGHEQREVPAVEQRTTCQSALVITYLCRQRGAWHTLPASVAGSWQVQLHGVRRQACFKGAGYNAKRKQAACAVLATAQLSLTSGAADAHHIHRGVLTMRTVASVYSIWSRRRLELSPSA